MGISAIRDNEDGKEILSDEYIWNFLNPWLKPKDAYLERKAIYSFQSAIARKWRRVGFLLLEMLLISCRHLWARACARRYKRRV